MKKVLIISYYWLPEKGVGHKRWLGFIEHFKSNGYEPIIFTKGNTNSVSKIKNSYTLIRKKIFDPSIVFSKIFKSDYNRGVIDNSNSIFISFFSWLRSSFFIPDSRIFWVRPSVKYLKQYIKENNIEIVLTTGPPHSMHLIGLKLKKILNIKWIADFRDPYSNWDILLNMRPSYFSKIKHKNYENLFLNNANHVIVTNSMLLKEFSFHMPNNNITCIPNGSLLPETVSSSKNDYFVISHFGLINKFRNPKVFLDVIKNILENNNEFKLKFKLIFCGPVNVSTLNYIKKDQILSQSFEYHKHVDEDQMINIMSNSSLLLLLLNNTEIQNTTPFKIYDYIISNKPLITLGSYNNNDVDSLLEKHKRKKRISYDDHQSIKKIILNSFSNYNKNKENLYSSDKSEIQFKYLSKKLFKIFEEI
ncbi:MAG: hypothetical protein VX263_04050 [Bacteroidota bacterium]|nr:hypothetical protein [Bacteroidota bacterium]